MGLQHVFSEIQNVTFIAINSEEVSRALDNTRDIFDLLILLMLCLFFLFSIDGLSRWPQLFPFLSLSLLWTACHFVWMFTLALLPIFHGIDIKERGEHGYFDQIQHSVTFHVGVHW